MTKKEKDQIKNIEKQVHSANGLSSIALLISIIMAFAVIVVPLFKAIRSTNYKRCKSLYYQHARAHSFGLTQIKNGPLKCHMLDGDDEIFRTYVLHD